MVQIIDFKAKRMAPSFFAGKTFFFHHRRNLVPKIEVPYRHPICIIMHSAVVYKVQVLLYTDEKTGIYVTGVLIVYSMPLI